MLETLNLGRKYIHIYNFINLPFSTKASLILLMPAFFAKNQHLLAKIVPLLKELVAGELF